MSDDAADPYPKTEPYRTNAMAAASVEAAVRGVVKVYARGDRRMRISVHLMFLREVLTELSGDDVGAEPGEEELRALLIRTLEKSLAQFSEEPAQSYVIHDEPR